jgi:hypothetical protein
MDGLERMVSGRIGKAGAYVSDVMVDTIELFSTYGKSDWH